MSTSSSTAVTRGLSFTATPTSFRFASSSAWPPASRADGSHICALHDVGRVEESRPLRSDPGAFVFLLDFLGPEDDEHVKRALARIPELTLGRRVMGFNEPA